MARPRTPTTLKILRGTDRADRANPAEPKPAAMLDIEPPGWLNRRARGAWRDLLPVLREMNVLTVADPTAFALLCDALGEYVTARAYLARHPTVYEVEGVVRKRPEVDIAQDAWRRAKTMLTEFGLTPASRSRVSARNGSTADPLEKWATGG